MNRKIEQQPLKQDPIVTFRNNNLSPQEEVSLFPSQQYPIFYTNYAPIDYANIKSECLLGENECTPLCSGYTTNKCDLVAPIPGPQWQVQSAATVQRRLTNQEYTMSNAPLELPYPRKYY
jgi:hypothetical protein